MFAPARAEAASAAIVVDTRTAEVTIAPTRSRNGLWSRLGTYAGRRQVGSIQGYTSSADADVDDVARVMSCVVSGWAEHRRDGSGAPSGGE